MKLNLSFREFKSNHSKKKHQILFRARSCNQYYKVENLFRFLLAEKNSFIFESVEKGTIKGRYTIIGLNPDKIWDINKNIVTLNSSGKKTKIKSDPLKYINKLIKEFKIKIPNQLPSMSSMLVGYFSYDVIRYIEKIPNNCKDDLKIPDVRLSRPKNLIIYDNVKKKIFYVENVYADTKIKNYEEESCKFKYRSSIFKEELKGKVIITSVCFLLRKKPHKINDSYGELQKLMTGKENTIQKETP